MEASHNINIQGYLFDISKKILMVTPTHKFWEVTLDHKTVKFRVGKLKDHIQSNTQSVQKTYPTPELARGSIIQKIKQKLIKGYVCNEAKLATNNATQQLKRSDPQIKKSEKTNNKRDYSGQYYQKGKFSIKLEINNNKVKITRIGQTVDKKEQKKVQIKVFKTNQESVEFCLKQQQWLLGEGYHVNNSKFMYSFVDDGDAIQPESKGTTKKSQSGTITTKPNTHNNNFLSIVGLTDEAISRTSRSSRDLSPMKSDRTLNDLDDDDDGDKFVNSSSLGAPTTGCIKVLLAETWNDQVDPNGWYMSEKLDGVRCFWTGTQMFSRNANRFFPPAFFTKNWPKSQLDGELFIGRNRFSQTISAIKKGTPIDSEWEKVCYLVFDAPGVKKPFHQRVKIMEQTITKINSPYIKCHAHRICTGFTDMFTELQAVNKIKGEGLMLRDPNSFYENRRSKSLLKVKVFYDDEATILGYKQGTGRCYGMVGALKVRNTHGVQFQVGSGLNDDMRRHPPKIGTVITYKYQEFNASGKPRFPTFLRIYQGL